MNTFLQHINAPEYMHALINPLPVYGLSMGVVAMIVALISKRRALTVAALILIFVSGLSAWPTYSYGQAAYDRVKSMSDVAGGQWLDEHMARAERLIYAFYLLAAVALAGIFLPLKWARSSMPLAVTTLVLALGTLGIGGFIAYAGGHIRHKEFRFEPPPVAKSDDHTHTHGGGEGAMDDDSMPGMEGAKSGDAKEQPMQHDGAGKPAAPAAEQLEASRLQLEASRLQLEASRKQLEAANAAAAKTASPSPQQTQSPHAEDGHEHEPKP